jgi:hypothetical protein
MLRLRERAVFFITIFGLLFMAIPNAYAYLDPGTGSMLVQIIIAGSIGALFALKAFWKRIMAFFRKILRKSTPDS